MIYSVWCDPIVQKAYRKCIQLFRQRLSRKSEKVYATMSIGIMGSKNLALLDWGSRWFSNKERERTNTCLCCFLPPRWNILNYNIVRALVLCKSYWAVMNKVFMYARPCSIKWREQFHFSSKISVEFSARSFCLSFGNVKIIVSNPNPTSSLWLLPGKDVYLNVSILTLFVSVFIEYFYFVWLRCFCERKS